MMSKLMEQANIVGGACVMVLAGVWSVLVFVCFWF